MTAGFLQMTHYVGDSCEPNGHRPLPLILRPAQLDARACLMVSAVWRSWADSSKPPCYDTFRDLTGLRSKSSIHDRLRTLESHGWVRLVTPPPGDYVTVVLPGPRLGGIHGNTPLELVGAWQELAKEPSHRPSKWDRRGVLIRGG